MRYSSEGSCELECSLKVGAVWEGFETGEKSECFWGFLDFFWEKPVQKSTFFFFSAKERFSRNFNLCF